MLLKKSKSKLQFNKGMTMLETIITVALVSIFFTVIAYVLPATLEQYIHMRKTSEALSISTVVHSGIEEEISTSYHPDFYELKDYENGGTKVPAKSYSSIDMMTDDNDYGLRYVSKNFYHYFPENANNNKSDVVYSYSYDYDSYNYAVTEYKVTCVGKPTIYGTITDENFYDKYFVKIVIEYDRVSSSAKSHVIVYDDELLDNGITYEDILNDTDDGISCICKTDRTILMYN